MSGIATVNLEIIQGSNFTKEFRWGTDELIYKAITGATQSLPCRLTVSGHGAPNGWPVAISGIRSGMTQLNAPSWNKTSQKQIKTSDYLEATNINSNTIELNKINSSGFNAYTNGGYIQYYTPVDLTGYTARMQIRASVSSNTFLLELTTANGRIILDNTAKTITLSLTATETAALTWVKGIYASIEMVSAGGQVTALAQGSVVVKKEATR